MITNKELKKCLIDACVAYKQMVSQNGPDGTPGLLDRWSADDYYKKIEDNIEEFEKYIIKHPFFFNENKTLMDVIKNDYALFLYCLGAFLNDKFLGGLVSKGSLDDVIEIVNNQSIDAHINHIDTEEYDEEEDNKKEFIKEVFDGIPKKKSLKEFLEDPRSYKQFRNDVDHCLFYMDWEKIHHIMKNLKWKWAHWTDSDFNGHENTVPSSFGIREHVYNMIQQMEEWIMTHPDEQHYRCGTGGFEYEMWMCNEDDVDDYEHQVRFVVRFVLEQYDNGM